LDLVEQHEAFVRFLIERYAEHKRVVLIVDEAQNLGEEALEQLRMLSNVNAEADHLLQIILVGQPELRDLLQRPSLRQLVQRIAVDHHLAPLDRAEARAYLRHRLLVAGGDPGLFDDQACAAIHWFGQGIPRLINALADLSLVWAYADDRRQIDIDLVIEVALARSQGGLAGFRAVPEKTTQEQLKGLILRPPETATDLA
ncbi:MAG TPA: AAA family ATPase, partial [Geminicoccaceae bacterium]|nr:AAA family ATPase [Geminicoccaceae bacterium]